MDTPDDIALWHVAPSCVASCTITDPESAEDEELLESVWAAAHQNDSVAGWTTLRVRADQSPPSSVLYVEEAEVLIYSEAVRTAVDGVGGAASDHVWLPVALEAGDVDTRYWVLSCRRPDVARPDRTVDGSLVGDAAVVHFEIGDNFPAFTDAARRAIASAATDVVLHRANPAPAGPATPA